MENEILLNPPTHTASDLECAAENAKTAAEAGASEADLQHARLHGAYCNMNLGYRLYAAEMVHSIQEEYLPDEDRKLFDDLKLDLQAEIDSLRPVKGWIFPYGGLFDYSPKTIKDRASASGVYGGLSYYDWTLTLGVEKFWLKEVAGNASYSQVLYNGVLEKSLGPVWSAKVFGTSVVAPANPSVSGRTFGAGVAAAPFASTRFDADVSGSIYPTLTQSDVRAGAAAVSWTQTLWTGAEYSLASRLLSETVLIRAANRTDPVSGFVLDPSYERGALNLTLYTRRLQIGLEGWAGSEGLGVRESGAVVYNTLEKHRRGYAGNLQYRWISWLATRISVSREDYQSAAGETHSLGVVAGVILYL